MKRCEIKLAVLMALPFVLGGCANRMSIENQPEPTDQAATIAAPGNADDKAQREALQRKARALLASRQANVAPSSPLADEAAPMPAKKMPQASPGVASMLARARQGAAPAATPIPDRELPRTALSRAFHVKSEARLGDSNRNTGQIETAHLDLNYAAGATMLTANSRKALTDYVDKGKTSGLTRIILTAGLGGEAPAWQKMQIAAARLDDAGTLIVPPLSATKRFDPTLDAGTLRIETLK